MPAKKSKSITYASTKAKQALARSLAQKSARDTYVNVLRNAPAPPPSIKPLIPGLTSRAGSKPILTWGPTFPKTFANKKKKTHRAYCGGYKGENGEPYVRSNTVVCRFTSAKNVFWYEIIDISKKYTPQEVLNYADSALRKRIRALTKKYPALGVKVWGKNKQSGETEEIQLMDVI